MTSLPPLHGVTVVSLEQAVAAPFATRRLADLGAGVIKIELIAGRLATVETRAAGKLFDEAGVANAGINRIEDFLDHPVLAERHRWHEIAAPGGSVRELRPPVDLAGVEPVMGAVPALGQHTDSILRELGRTDAVVAALRDSAVG